MKNILIAFVLVFLTACGGGGGAGVGTLTIPATQEPSLTREPVMTAGLQIINDNGVLQLDENYKNLEFKEKRTVYIPGNGMTVDVVTPGYANEILAIGLSDEPNWNSSYGIVSKVVGASSITYKLTSGTASNGANVELYLFGEPTAAQGNTGLQVYNSAGQLTFDSNNKYMKVAEQFKLDDRSQLSVFRYDVQYKPAIVLSHTRISGIRYSAIPNNPVIRFDTIGVYGSQAGGYLFFISHYQTSYPWINGMSLPLDQEKWIQPAGGFAVVLDVTGL